MPVPKMNWGSRLHVLDSPETACLCCMHFCTFGVDVVVGTCPRNARIQRVSVEYKKPSHT